MAREGSPQSWGARLHDLLARSIDGASLAMFRICYGLVICWHAIKYLWPGRDGNLIHRYFVDPAWNFTYPGFEWVQPLSEPLMNAVFVVLAVAGLFLAAGLFHRVAAAVICVLFTYAFLLEETRYLNHYYLMCLLAFLLIWMPAARCWSVSAWWKHRRSGDTASAEASVIAFWPVFLLRAQLFIVYFYAGLAKLNPDWLSGRSVWSAANRTLESAAGLLGKEQAALEALVSLETVAQWIAIGGLVFDLAIGFMLLVRRTRLLAILLVAGFHFFNSQTFHIGVFPMLAFTATLIFFDADWPRRVGRWLRRPRFARPHLGWLLGGAVALPVLGAALGWSFRASSDRAAKTGAQRRLPRVVLLFVTLWTAFHVVWPLRHYAIPGDAQWTEEGHYFAWRMMLRSKSGFVRLEVFDGPLFRTDAAGVTQVNWDEWTRAYPKRLHVDVDACAVDWRKLPPLVVVFEPLVGERVLYNFHARDALRPDEARTWIKQHWREAYGREPRLYWSLPVQTSLAQLKTEYATSPDLVPDDTDTAELFAQAVDDAAGLAAETPRTVLERESRSMTMDQVLDFAVSNRSGGPLVQRWLSRTHPFELQGARYAGRPFLIIDDPELLHFDRHQRQILARSDWQFTHVVHLDMKRLRDDAWNSLPQAIVCHEAGRPHVLWNAHAELRAFQLHKFKSRPYMVHQYAQHIAELWQANFGRRPEVYATSSHVELNNRPPLPIIDPSIDLCDVPLKLFTPNDWILPSPTEVDRGPPSGGPTAPAGVQVVYQKYPNGEIQMEKRTHVRDGVSHSTVALYTEDGRRAMRAQYRDGQKHGVAEQWYRNGQLATRVSYQDGRRHGPAVTWYMNGQESWRAKFVDGKQVGQTTGWSGDGQVADRATFAAGQRLDKEDETQVARQPATVR